MKFYHFLPTFLKIIVFLVKIIENQSCISNLQLCELTLPLNQINHAVIATRSGLSQSECLQKMETFDWSAGVYCKNSQFCGLGLDLDPNYKKMKILGKIEPVSELCKVFLSRDTFHCSDFKNKLIEIGILRR